MENRDKQEHCHATEGLLDGKTVLRFTHSKKDGAGIENHLRCLNQALLQRNAMTIIQLYTPGDQSCSTESVNIGKGTLLKIPLPIIDLKKSAARQHPVRRFVDKISTTSMYVQTKKAIDSFRFLHYTLSVWIIGEKRRQLYETRFLDTSHLDVVIRKLFKRDEVDLVVNHFIGGKDSLLLMKEATAYTIPILVVNHFSNQWFNFIPIREQLRFATQAAGVTGRNLPHHIRNNFVNLSNGIDVDFFNRHASSISSHSEIKPFTILHPARIARGKGQLDLLKAMHALHTQGNMVKIIFAGRIDSIDYFNEISAFIHKHALQGYVTFKGTLDQVSLRSLYSECSLVVLPTYQEGFPRVLLEAQAMNIPPIAYRVDGTPEAVMHNHTGILVQRGSINELAKSIKKLLLNEHLKRQMGSLGREYVEKNFSTVALAHRHELLYSRLINRQAH